MTLIPFPNSSDLQRFEMHIRMNTLYKNENPQIGDFQTSLPKQILLLTKVLRESRCFSKSIRSTFYCTHACWVIINASCTVMRFPS